MIHCLFAGDRLFKIDRNEYRAGTGTFERHGFIVAALAGFLHVRKTEDGSIVEVHRDAESSSVHSIPFVGAIVKCRVNILNVKHSRLMPSNIKVVSINNKFAKCQITAVEASDLKSNFTGMIRHTVYYVERTKNILDRCFRKEDIRAVDKDRAEVHRSFRPGDGIVARVLDLGDSYSFLLTTAEDELGVVSGICDEGHTMVPVSWTEMECRNCETKYQRKIAKVPHATDTSTESKGKLAL